MTPARAADFETVRAALARHPEIGAIHLALEGRGWIVASGRVQPVAITGYEGDLPLEFPDVESRSPGLYLGRSTAARLGVGEGSIVTVASPKPTLTPLGPAPRTVTLRVQGLFASGRSEEVARVAMPGSRSSTWGSTPARSLASS